MGRRRLLTVEQEAEVFDKYALRKELSDKKLASHYGVSYFVLYGARKRELARRRRV